MGENLNNIIEINDSNSFKGKIVEKKVDNEKILSEILEKYSMDVADSLKKDDKKEYNK